MNQKSQNDKQLYNYKASHYHNHNFPDGQLINSY